MTLASTFRRFFGQSRTAPPQRARPHLVSESWPSAIYAIGDVHGCLAELTALERKIVEDASEVSGEKWIVLLGDYVDRGANSAGVLEHLLSPPPVGFTRFCLAGNHEAMMLDFVDAPGAASPWLKVGGLETLASYGIHAPLAFWNNKRAAKALLNSSIPAEHLALLRKMPLYLSLPGTVLVHAGIRRGIALDDQVEDDLLWIREQFFSVENATDLRVVHGHTPSPEPVVTPSKIGVDTGAFVTGILTAVKLTPEGHAFLSTAA